MCKMFWKTTSNLELLVFWYSVKWLFGDGRLKKSEAIVNNFELLCTSLRQTTV